jgi:hypothetical protein
MYTYKVEYIYAAQEKKKWYQSSSPLDVWTLAKELEALLEEYHAKGYDLVSINPILTYDLIHGTYPGARTDGLMVTFRERGAP